MSVSSGSARGAMAVYHVGADRGAALDAANNVVALSATTTLEEQ
jgi:hypothetical protein